MSRRGENIYKRKDGRWEARVTITDGRGNSHQVSFYGKTYKEAKEKKLLARENATFLEEKTDVCTNRRRMDAVSISGSKKIHQIKISGDVRAAH